MEYWESTNECANYADARYVGIPRTTEKPNGGSGGGDKQDPVDLSPVQRMFVLVAVFVAGKIKRLPLFDFFHIPGNFGLFQLR
jgi:hypothetical protein